MSVLEFSVKTATLGGDAFVVTLAGELDLHTAPELEQALEGVVGLGGTAVAVDLAEVTFIDSTTLEVLLRYHERFRALGGAVVIVTDDRRVLRTFEITGLDRVFTIERRLADAVAAILPDSAPT
jgi:anti-sigma B factor antagonist